MTNEQMTTMLSMLKVDLGITTTSYDSRLGEYLQSAVKQITMEGAALDLDDIEDCQLTTMYAAWTWRKRDTGEGMPRMLRYQLNNRIFSGKVTANG